MGLYLVQKIGEHGQFYLAELDGTELGDPFTRNRVKRLRGSYEIMKEAEEMCGDLRDEGHGDLARVMEETSIWYTW